MIAPWSRAPSGSFRPAATSTRSLVSGLWSLERHGDRRLKTEDQRPTDQDRNRSARVRVRVWVDSPMGERSGEIATSPTCEAGRKRRASNWVRTQLLHRNSLPLQRTGGRRSSTRPVDQLPGAGSHVTNQGCRSQGDRGSEGAITLPISLICSLWFRQRPQQTRPLQRFWPSETPPKTVPPVLPCMRFCV